MKDEDKFIKAVPVDKKFPWILIFLNDAVKQKLKLPGKVNKFQYWPVTISKWDDTSILPLGKIGDEAIGQAGDCQAEVKRALCENGLDDHDVDFTDEMLDEVDTTTCPASSQTPNQSGSFGTGETATHARHSRQPMQ